MHAILGKHQMHFFSPMKFIKFCLVWWIKLYSGWWGQGSTQLSQGFPSPPFSQSLYFRSV